jgi:hypothetical protein
LGERILGGIELLLRVQHFEIECVAGVVAEQRQLHRCTASRSAATCFSSAARWSARSASAVRASETSWKARTIVAWYLGDRLVPERLLCVVGLEQPAALEERAGGVGAEHA